MTRAAQQLYVIGEKPKESSADDSLKTYSDLLVNFLDFSGKWESGKCKYCFGSRKENKLRNKSAVKSIKPKLFYSTAKKNLNVSIIQSKIQDRNSFKNEAIKKGNLIHSILAKVYVKSDVDDVINEFLKVGLISKTESEEFSKIVPEIKNYLKNKFITSDEILITRDRHRQHLEQCLEHLKNFNKKNEAEDLDKAAEDLRLATRHLGMIVGKVDVEEILGSIFNDFCIGK